MNTWITEHLNDDTSRLRLKYGHEHADDILQIECRRKYAAKLGEVISLLPDFRFPTALSGEQSTSWALARFHASLLEPGRSVVDLTAGLGIDAFAMSRRGLSVTAVERDPAVAQALRDNYGSLPGFTVVEADCRDFLRDCDRHFDYAFIDPARRSADGGRVYALADCEPDVTAMLPRLREICAELVVKASPMLDITHTLAALPDTRRMIVLGTTTECKELDSICHFGHAPASEPFIEAVTIGPGVDSRFTFRRSEETAATASYAMPRVGQYIYEPYPAVMKSGAMKLLSARYGLSKFHANTHLWFGEAGIADFPGRAFEITEILPYASKHIKRYRRSHPQVSVTTRNFPVGADALRAKLAVREGGSERLFAVTTPDPLLITTKKAP